MIATFFSTVYKALSEWYSELQGTLGRSGKSEDNR
jgi:hypothetical protein